MAKMNVYEVIVWYSVFGLSRRAVGTRVIVAISIFAVKFMLGGMAMFIRLAISHHAVIIGRMLWNPRVSIRIRVCVRSYVMFARQNSIDDVNPCAIISAIAPATAQ